jgi:hypothetical protein
VIVGNTGTTVLPPRNGTEERTIKAARGKDWVMTKADGRDIYTPHPKASEILDARPGRLKFKYDNGTVVTIEKGDQ